MVVHVGVAEPFCTELSALLLEAVNEAGAVSHNGGTFITIEGPRFSTQGKSNLYRAWGMSIIGMTASPEAFLARGGRDVLCDHGARDRLRRLAHHRRSRQRRYGSAHPSKEYRTYSTSRADPGQETSPEMSPVPALQRCRMQSSPGLNVSHLKR